MDLTISKPKKMRTTVVEEYKLENRILNLLAENRGYQYIATDCEEHMRTRSNPVPDFHITAPTIKRWWMNNFHVYEKAVVQKRNAFLTRKFNNFLSRGTKVREEVQKELKKDAEKARDAAETSMDYEATARIAEKRVKVQESGEKFIARQSPNINFTQIVVNPLDKFTEQVRKIQKKQEEEDEKTIDIEYEDIPDEEPEVSDEDEDNNEDDED